ncbi:hypothetical protein LGH82_32110 [Mesorhizobium sp. PAMC28654]|uniref:hypothetical protein n=1 Tax=Mesorhizobium sp. PAMC28654 TaxID=2880934 RepID=UPI001D0B7AF3|nr:hypothetical protein [Mesorhizobium sp. PAMC28654]UDL89637.1 hypothetical protein LGH82_32110 [Mesorhizobium sp. PAMC28654]
MGRFARLIREITPAWLNPRFPRRVAVDASLPGAADSSWREAVDNKMHGADTSDYSHVPEQPVSGTAGPAGDRPKTVKNMPRGAKKPK